METAHAFNQDIYDFIYFWAAKLPMKTVTGAEGRDSLEEYISLINHNVGNFVHFAL